jgi:uncharacterized protein YjeT (DUF2065 family)
MGLRGRGGIGKVDVTETTAAARVPLGNDTSADEALAVLEGLVQALVSDAPRQAAGEQGLGALSLIGLGLLGLGVDLIVSLALLGGRSSLLFLGLG